MNQVSACMGPSKTNSGGNGATRKGADAGYTMSMSTGGSIPGK